MKAEPKLLSCPFCNGTAEFAIYSRNKSSNGVAVRCCTCGAETSRRFYEYRKCGKEMPFLDVLKLVNICKGQVAEMWNKRFQLKETEACQEQPV
jgi:hypothetical protein